MTFESEGLLIVAIYIWLPPASYVVFLTTLVTRKFVAVLLILTQKISYLSDFKPTKSKTLRTASTGRMTN